MRKYLPTFADLVDRLSIVLLKSIFIPEHHQEYLDEAKLIEHDLNMFFDSFKNRKAKLFGVRELKAGMVIMLANRFIWENESKARQGGSDQDKLLKATHSVNGIRAVAKNVLSRWLDEREDLKVDCLAADLPPEFGNWRGLFDA